jgi:glycosyltransferase involved in cell wall biosynthesis
MEAMKEAVPVLLIACHFPPENIVGSLRPGRFFRYLPEYGYAPYVLTASRQTAADPRVTVAPYVHDWKGKLWLLTLAPYDDKPSWAGAAARAGAELLRRQPARLVLSTSPPYSVHTAAAALARRFGIPWIADVRDPLLGNASRRESGVHGWIDRRMEQTILGADRVILNTEAAQADWRRRYPSEAARFDVLYNGFDPSALPEPAGPLPERRQRILLHAGSLYMHQYMEILLRALRGLAERGRIDTGDFQLQMIGAVPDEVPALEDFQYLAGKGLASNAGHHLPQEEARRMMRDSNYLLLVDYYKKDGGSLQLPAKVFDYLAVGRPILAITTPDSPMHRVLELSGLPHVALFPSDSGEAAMEKVERLLALPPGPHAPSAGYLERFDGREQTAELARIFDRVLGN